MRLNVHTRRIVAVLWVFVFMLDYHSQYFAWLLFTVATLTNFNVRPLVNIRNYEAPAIHHRLFFPACESNNETKWPDVELFLSMPLSKAGMERYRRWFLPSLALFWPISKPIKLLLATDADGDEHSPVIRDSLVRFAEKQARLMIDDIAVRGELIPRAFPCSGWDKSQWLKMWADNFTNAAYVGFVDIDTVFVTRVTLPDFFINGKPVVRPMFGKPRKGGPEWWHHTPSNTYKYTGYKEPFNCMTYFPIVVRTAHLASIRERVRRQLNATTFDEAFSTFPARRFYSEFNIICTVLWWEYRDDYYWAISETEVGWNGTAPYGQVANAREAEIPAEFLERTRPQLTIHWGHYAASTRHDALLRLLRKGYCYSLTKSEHHPDYCSEFDSRTSTVNEFEFLFEEDNFSTRPVAFQSHVARIKRNEQCPHDWRFQIVAKLA